MARAEHKPVTAPGDDVRIDEALVARLVLAQFPRWADRSVRAVRPGGWDNRTFRLGRDLSARLPSAARYAAQAPKEHAWLPRLAPGLPLPVPVPVALGRPASEYPWPWSIRRWLDGDAATAGVVGDLVQLATDLGRFLVALRRLDSSGGPPPGRHNFFRGGALAVYDAETRAALASLRGVIDVEAAAEAWETALGTTWSAAPVWIHGDVSADNLLVRDGRLGAVIDFGCMGVGDPACDAAIAWTHFAGPSRRAFRRAMELDDDTWARARAWALWKALVTLAGRERGDPARTTRAGRTLDAVLSDALPERNRPRTRAGSEGTSHEE